MVEKQTQILSIVAPTVPMWAVFTSEDGEPEIWTERVHLWAHTKTGLSAEDKESEEFLRHDVPDDEFKVEAMVLNEGYLVLVSESYTFLGYSPTEEPDPETWKREVESARRRYRGR